MVFASLNGMISFTPRGIYIFIIWINHHTHSIYILIMYYQGVKLSIFLVEVKYHKCLVIATVTLRDMQIQCFDWDYSNHFCNMLKNFLSVPIH